MRGKILLYISTLALLFAVMRLDASVADTTVLRSYESSMHYAPGQLKAYSDSVYMEAFSEMRYFNSDSFFYKVAHYPLESIYEDVYYYYTDIVTYLNEEEVKDEMAKMMAAAKLYKSKKLEYETEYLSAYISKDKDVDASLADMQQVAEKAADRKDYQMQARALQEVFSVSYNSGRYHTAFKTADPLLKVLDKVTDAELPDKRYVYYYLGDAYYAFRDYERAIPLLHKALTDSSSMFYDRGNLRARNTLGVYYAAINQRDSARYYFTSMLESPDMVKYRPMYDCIAISNLGHLALADADYDLALTYFRAGLPKAYKEKDFSFATGIIIGMGEAWLGKGDLEKTGAMIDSAYTIINQHNLDTRNRKLYPLMGRYYAELGNARLSQAYMDSALAANRRYDERFNTLIMLRAEQDIFEAERQLKENAIKNQRIVLVSIASVTAAILALLIVYIYLYRRKQGAYRELVRKSREWARTQRKLPVQRREVDPEDVVVMETILDLMEKEQLYKEMRLSVEQFAEKTGFHRNAISKAINNTQKKNFAAFVNDYRIQEAILLLSDSSRDNDTIDMIAYDCGFGDRKSFYRIFKKATGLSPSLFRQQDTGD